MEIKDDEFQHLKNKVEHISSELDKQNTVRVVNTKWMLIVGAIILSALGFTNFVKIPSEVVKSVKIAVEKEVEEEINKKTGTEIIAEAINLRNQLVMIKAEALKSKNKLIEITKNVRKEDFVNLPIGTIIPSMFDPDSFAEVVMDPQDFDPENSKWVLADKQKDLTGSKYYKLIGESSTPDLRGMFLRGMNVDGGADPDKDRKVGLPQLDALQKHGHKTMATQQGWEQFGTNKQGYKSDGYAGRANVTEVKGARKADETRPKNVAVYFYIKIN